MKLLILISINPPYSQMIVDKYKFMEFRNVAPKNIQKNVCLSQSDDITVYFYETKNQGGCGKIIGEANLLQIYDLKYKSINNPTPNTTLMNTRECFINELYDIYCFVKKLKPTTNLSTHEKYQFRKYQYEIGFNSDVDYAWEFTNIIKYNKPKDLKEFGIAKAPHSWCFIKETNKKER